MHPAKYATIYWPVWLITSIMAFLAVEIYALASGHPENTLSDWVWRTLKIGINEKISNWTAADYLTFGVWIVLFTWLTFHFFFRKFT